MVGFPDSRELSVRRRIFLACASNQAQSSRATRGTVLTSWVASSCWPFSNSSHHSIAAYRSSSLSTFRMLHLLVDNPSWRFLPQSECLRPRRSHLHKLMQSMASRSNRYQHRTIQNPPRTPEQLREPPKERSSSIRKASFLLIILTTI